MEKEKDRDVNIQKMKDPLLKLSFDVFAPVTVSLPLGALIFCFTSAMIFQFDEVNKTMCKVSLILLYSMLLLLCIVL